MSCRVLSRLGVTALCHRPNSKTEATRVVELKTCAAVTQRNASRIVILFILYSLRNKLSQGHKLGELVLVERDEKLAHVGLLCLVSVAVLVFLCAMFLLCFISSCPFTALIECSCSEPS